MHNFESIDAVHKNYIELTLDRWLNIELFSLQWWLQIIFVLVCYLIWWKLVDKKRLMELLLFGSFIAVVWAAIDASGVEWGAWAYPYRMVPFSIRLFPWDFTVVPIIFMLVYQYTTSWKSYLITSGIFSGIYSLGINTLLIKLQMLRLFNWHQYYTFVLLFIGTIICRFALLLVIKKQSPTY